MHETITSVQNPLVKHLAHVRQNSDYRDEHHTVLIEGTKLVSELCQKEPAISLLVTDGSKIPAGVMAKKTYIVNEAILKKITGLNTSEGIAAEIKLPSQSSLNTVSRLLVCDEINDPGNMGTLIRSALALGWDAVFIVHNSCDPFNDKVIRAAKGANFRLPYRIGSWKELRKLAEQQKLVPYVADIQGVSLDKVKHTSKSMLVLGNEAHGVSEEAKQFCQAITIPMSGDMESLNVAAAGAIMMYALAKG